MVMQRRIILAKLKHKLNTLGYIQDGPRDLSWSLAGDEIRLYFVFAVRDMVMRPS